jgi:hypothetical protein
MMVFLSEDQRLILSAAGAPTDATDREVLLAYFRSYYWDWVFTGAPGSCWCMFNLDQNLGAVSVLAEFLASGEAGEGPKGEEHAA